MPIAADVVRVVNEYDLEMNTNIVKLGFRLPTGDVVYAETTPEVLNKLERYKTHERPASAPPRRAPQRRVEDEAPPLEELPEGLEPAAADVEEYGAHVELDGHDLEEGEEVLWGSLPEELLPEHVKTAMRSMLISGHQLPDLLQLGQVVQIRDAILDEYTADDWGKLGFTADPGVPLNRVQWSEGVTTQPNARPQRGVSHVDEKGNPIVRPNPNDVDPGEIAATGDEDGVDEF